MGSFEFHKVQIYVELPPQQLRLKLMDLLERSEHYKGHFKESTFWFEKIPFRRRSNLTPHIAGVLKPSDEGTYICLSMNLTLYMKFYTILFGCICTYFMIKGEMSILLYFAIIGVLSISMYGFFILEVKNTTKEIISLLNEGGVNTYL